MDNLIQLEDPGHLERIHCVETLIAECREVEPVGHGEELFGYKLGMNALIYHLERLIDSSGYTGKGSLLVSRLPSMISLASYIGSRKHTETTSQKEAGASEGHVKGYRAAFTFGEMWVLQQMAKAKEQGLL